MHAWGDPNAKRGCLCVILPIHARMGRPRVRIILAALPNSYPCTHGATNIKNLRVMITHFLSMHAWGNRVFFHFSYAIYFLPMHAWGNQESKLILFLLVILTHARMGQPFHVLRLSNPCFSYPCTHGATQGSELVFLPQYFLPMHAWGNPLLVVIVHPQFFLTHARMGQPLITTI